MPATIDNPGANTPADAPTPGGPSVIQTILDAAFSALGVTYRWGGNSLATGVDCSGLVQQAFLAGGYSLPRVSADQARTGRQLASISEARPGDLLSWDNSSRNNGADHIAIYLGNGLMIEAPGRNKPIRVVAVRGNPTINRVIGAVPQGAPRNVARGPSGQTWDASSVAATDEDPGGADLQNAEPPGAAEVGLPDDATDEQIREYITGNYPFAAFYLDHPELGPILREAALEGFSPAMLQGKVFGTEWWQTTSSTARAWENLQVTDPASAIERQADMERRITTLWRQLGGGDDTTGQIAALALHSLRFGWADDEQTLRQAVIGALAFTPGEGGGEQAVTVDQLQQIAAEYGYPIARDELADWTRDILSKYTSIEAFRSHVAERAEGADPWTSGLIERGFKPDQISAALKQVTAEWERMGGDPSQLPILQMATFGLMTEGWDRGTLRTQLTPHLAFRPGEGGGQQSVTVDQLQALAIEYGYPITLAELEQWTRDILADKQSLDSFRSHVSEQAEIREPWTSNLIESGRFKPRDIANQQSRITLMLKQMGAVPEDFDAELKMLTAASMLEEWDSARLQNELAKYVSLGAGAGGGGGVGAPGGQGSVTAAQLQQIARQYAVEDILTTEETEDWIRRIIGGEQTPQSFQAQMAERAASLYPHLADRIRGGETTRSIFQGHTALIARELDLNPSQVDIFNDPRFGDVVAWNDGEVTRDMTLAETRRHIRSLPDARFSTTARDTASGAVEELARRFGQVA